jgi:hypothetical protein
MADAGADGLLVVTACVLVRDTFRDVFAAVTAVTRAAVVTGAGTVVPG